MGNVEKEEEVGERSGWGRGDGEKRVGERGWRRGVGKRELWERREGEGVENTQHSKTLHTLDCTS